MKRLDLDHQTHALHDCQTLTCPADHLNGAGRLKQWFG